MIHARQYDPELSARLITAARALVSDEGFPNEEFPFPDRRAVNLATRLVRAWPKASAVSASEYHEITEALLTAYDQDAFPVRARKIIGELVSQLEAAAQRASTTIWIVERTRQEDYGETKHVVSWHESLTEARSMQTRLQAEFDQACERAWPWYEVVETIYEMYEEHTTYRLLNNLEDPAAPLLPLRAPTEHEEALSAQLCDWWHQESRAWQTFVQDEILTKMIDPPHNCYELVHHHEFPVHYRCRAVGHDPAVTRAEHEPKQVP